MHQIKIAEDAVEREGQRQHQAVCSELLHRLRADRVERIGDDRGRRHDRDHLVEQVRAVFLQDPAMAGRAVCEQHQFVPPLAEREEQRAENRQHVQPVADRHVDGDGARHRPQHESDRDRQHVEDHDVLERRRIQREQHDVRRRDGAETARSARTRRRAPRSASTAAPPSATGTGTAPEAIGRLLLTGCSRSASRSATSLMR